ncbi:hypothetical protein QAD02_017553 [Eretmocerus hayati]|uniref:Uncharacterized protein n=1 Tax=Eretmocerus hayati TaxID=131215 RepID=A0ACC2PG15_9HYME|nr:hypothetical protein QAD02_017553 [Eretmocerus hayati]
MMTEKTIICQLFGGWSKNVSGCSLRGNIHVLMIGDPGVGKSRIMLAAQRLTAQNTQKIVGIGNSLVGLTSCVVEENLGRYGLRPGAAAMADGSILCVDELAHFKDPTTFNEIMEQQTISGAKADVKETLNAFQLRTRQTGGARA